MHTGYAEVTGTKKPNIELSANCREFEMNDLVRFGDKDAENNDYTGFTVRISLCYYAKQIQ